MDSGFIVTLVAFAVVTVLVAERNGIVTQDMRGNALALERLMAHRGGGVQWLKEKASGRFLNCHKSSIAEIGGNCKDYFAFLFAFVGDEKGLEEAAIIAKRCNPRLALGECASELLILRPLMVDDVAVCFGSLFLDCHESILAEIRRNCKLYFDFFQAV